MGSVGVGMGMGTEAENMSGKLRVLYVVLVPSHHIEANNCLQFPVPGHAVPFSGLCLHLALI